MSTKSDRTRNRARNGLKANTGPGAKALLVALALAALTAAGAATTLAVVRLLSRLLNFEKWDFPEVRICGEKRGSMAEGGGCNPHIICRQRSSALLECAENTGVATGRLFRGIQHGNGFVGKEFGQLLFLQFSPLGRGIDPRTVFADYLDWDENPVEFGNNLRGMRIAIEEIDQESPRSRAAAAGATCGAPAPKGRTPRRPSASGRRSFATPWASCAGRFARPRGKLGETAVRLGT